MWTLLFAACDVSTPPAPEPIEARSEPGLSSLDDLKSPSESTYSASHILIGHADAARSSATRTRAEALDLATQLKEEVTPANFASLAREHSDGPSSPRGGELGVFPVGTMIPLFERAVASVEPGEIAPLIETPFGFHVIRRDPIRSYRVAHLVIRHAESYERGERSKEAAEQLANSLAGKITAATFDDQASKHSDDPTHDLGTVHVGTFVPEFERAALGLEVGEVSGVVQTPYGFHIMKRLPPLP